MQQEYYNLDNIDNKEALINIIYGERSGGKSYQVKHKKAIVNYLNSPEDNRERFMLVRRLQEELETDKIEAYFADVNIKELTNGEYNAVIYYSKRLYLGNRIIGSPPMKGELIGYVVSLSTEQNYAGGSYLDVTNIIFEEFMSRKAYLTNEPDKLINLWNTVDRKRGKVRMWLVGNSITRVCPYLTEWGLQPLVRQTKQGEISTKLISTNSYDKDGNEVFVKLALEHCKDTGKTSYAIGKHADMLNKGSWQSDPQPHLPKSYKKYIIKYRIGFEYKEFKFIGELLKDSETREMIWFIYPYEKEFKENDLFIFSDVVKSNQKYQRNIYNLSFKNERLQQVLNTFREGNIFYSSDLCGTDFKQVIDFTIIK